MKTNPRDSSLPKNKIYKHPMYALLICEAVDFADYFRPSTSTWKKIETGNSFKFIWQVKIYDTL